MGNKSRRRRNKSLSKKEITFMVKIGTVVAAVVVAILLGIFIPKSMNKDSSSIEMTKEYEPGEDVSSSLKKNEEVENLIDDDTPKDTISIKNEEVLLEESNDETAKEETKESLEDIIIEEPNEETGDDEEITNELKDESVSNDESSKNTSPESTSSTSTDADKGVDSEANTNTTESSDENNEEAINIEEATDNNIDESTNIEETSDPADEEQYVKDEWVDDMIQDNKDSIDSNDLAAGAAIYNKLDTAYLFALADGGMTDDEKAEAMLYLETNLSAEEFILAKALFNKYIGLAN